MNSLPSDEGSIHTSAAISQPAIIPARNFCIGGFCIICSDMTITALCTSVPRTPVKDVKAAKIAQPTTLALSTIIQSRSSM